MTLIVNYERRGDEIPFRLVGFRTPKAELGAVDVCEGGQGGQEFKCYVFDMGGELDISIVLDAPRGTFKVKPVSAWKRQCGAGKS